MKMTFLDTINSLTGATKKAKGAQISQIGDDLTAVEETIASEITNEWLIENIPNDILMDIDKGQSVLLRLVSKLELSYTDELANELILVGRAILLLKTVELLEFGWHLDPSEIKEFSLRFPELYKILAMSEDEIGSYGREARNTLVHLYEKYPY